MINVSSRGPLVMTVPLLMIREGARFGATAGDSGSKTNIAFSRITLIVVTPAISATSIL
jgi:hypothetical protein